MLQAPRVLLALVVVGFPACAPQNQEARRASPSIPSTLAELESYVEQAMHDWRVPGMAIGIVASDSIWLARGFGVRRTVEPEPVDSRTLFGILSPTKTFTTTALAILAEEGRLSWDDRVVEHLPHFRLSDPVSTGQLRIRDLVSHRSGYPDAPRLWAGTSHDPEELLRRLSEVKAVAPLGREFQYNNLMYVVAGQVIEAVSGSDWGEFVRRRIFDPLGMERSTTSVTALAGRDNVASPHARRIGNRIGPPRPIPYFDADNIAPAGMIHSNAVEMTSWLRLHLNEGVHSGQRLLDSASTRELQRPHVGLGSAAEVDPAFVPLRGLVDSLSYGLGWFVLRYRGERAVMHGGGITGQRSAVGLLPEAGVGVVILSNMEGTEIALALMYQVFDLFLDAEPHDWSRAFLDAR